MKYPRGERRSAIIDAAYACISEHGYDGATTAMMCARAGVSSGTFFHYFPTKLDVLIAVLEAGVAHTEASNTSIVTAAHSDANIALRLWSEQVVADATDPALPGFVAAIGLAPSDERVTEVLDREQRVSLALLRTIAEHGQHQGTVRSDYAPDVVAQWLNVVGQGVVSDALVRPPDDSATLKTQLQDVIQRIVAPE